MKKKIANTNLRGKKRTLSREVLLVSVTLSIPNVNINTFIISNKFVLIIHLYFRCQDKIYGETAAATGFTYPEDHQLRVGAPCLSVEIKMVRCKESIEMKKTRKTPNLIVERFVFAVRACLWGKIIRRKSSRRTLRKWLV